MSTVGLIAALLLGQADPSRLAVIEQAADFTLTTQDGATFKFSGQKGKVVLVSFVFTTCNGSCPATTHRMSLIQRELKERGLLKEGKVHLLSVTLDPARDTPEVLRGYQKLYDGDPATWTMLSGGPDEVAKVIAAWGMWVKPTANGQLDHPSRVFLVDQQGRVREIYHLGFLKPAWVAEDVQLLLGEK